MTNEPNVLLSVSLALSSSFIYDHSNVDLDVFPSGASEPTG